MDQTAKNTFDQISRNSKMFSTIHERLYHPSYLPVSFVLYHNQVDMISSSLEPLMPCLQYDSFSTKKLEL